jgi:predicted Zn-dependent peptidase
MEGRMAEIILKTDTPDKAAEVLKEALETETLRLNYSLRLAKKRLRRFEIRYNISSEKFINEWSAENLRGKDLEYVEWAGEYQLFLRLNDRFAVLRSIENVT